MLTDKQTHTYSIQSTVMMNEMLSRGSPTDVNTIVMVTMPPCGIPAAPIAPTVAVMLELHKTHVFRKVSFANGTGKKYLSIVQKKTQINNSPKDQHLNILCSCWLQHFYMPCYK